MLYRSLLRLTLLSAALLWLGQIPANAQDSSFTSDFLTVLQDCANANGVWSDDDKGYGCTKANCDGKGNSKDPHSCTVGCTNEGDCKGHTPSILVGNVTILMLLQNGSNVNHSYDAADTPPPNHPNRDSTPKAGANGGSCVGRAC